MQIGKLARAAGVSVRSVRHYEAVGLIACRRSDSGYRQFEAEDVELVIRIRRMIGLGFSTAEIKTVLPGISSPTTDCVAVTRAHGKKLEQIERQIADLERRRAVLVTALHSAAADKACNARDASERERR